MPAMMQTVLQGTTVSTAASAFNVPQKIPGDGANGR